jgi:hypothetical protein
MTSAKSNTPVCPFVSLADFDGIPILPVRFAIEGLVRCDTPRPFGIIGKPGDGKSTDAEQMAADFAIGRPYKGRAIVTPGAVVWAGTEESVNTMRRRFRDLGYDPQKHHAIYILDRGLLLENPLTAIHKFIAENPNVRLCLMETLSSFVRMKDMNNNTDVKEAFDRFHKLVAHDLYERCAFGGILQLKKRDLDTAGEMICGATEIRAQLDAQIYIRKISDNDERRKFMVRTREGTDIPWTFLQYDKDARISTLGQTVKEEYRSRMQHNKTETREAIRAGITDYLLKNPNSTQADIMASKDVSGRTNTKFEVLNEGVEKGWFSRSNSGEKGKAYRYSCCELPNQQEAA